MDYLYQQGRDPSVIRHWNLPGVMFHSEAAPLNSIKAEAWQTNFSPFLNQSTVNRLEWGAVVHSVTDISCTWYHFWVQLWVGDLTQPTQKNEFGFVAQLLHFLAFPGHWINLDIFHEFKCRFSRTWGCPDRVCNYSNTDPTNHPYTVCITCVVFLPHVFQELVQF